MSAAAGVAQGGTGAAEPDAQYRRLVFPSDYRNPSPADRYDLVVIGAGPAGLVTSITAASLGARVALVERRAMGGDCLNVGCVPSKTLLAAAAAGLSYDAAVERVRSVRTRIAHHDSVERYTGSGVAVFLGEAVFEAAHRVRVGQTVLNTRRTVIATGARAVLPPIPGLADIAPLTYETVFEQRTLPRSLAVLGAGAIGCELAQAFARLGSRVELIERAHQILPAEATQAVRLIAAALARDGVTLHLGATVQSAVRTAAGKTLMLADGRRIVADEVLVAAGRCRNVDGLGLERAGVNLDARAMIAVDVHLRTSHPHIYAAGDVCSAHPFTHAADAHARIVIRNALFGGRGRVDRLVVPRCVYTRPELAQVGAGVCELERAGRRFERHRVDWGQLDRGATDDADDGFVEVLADGRGRILGATLVGRDAGEQIAPLVVLMSRRVALGSLGSLVLPYPTRSEYLRRVADAHVRGRLTPRVAGWLRWWLRRG